MSEMASWFETKDGFCFVTDDDVKAYHDQKGFESKDIDWNNFVGHYGIGKCFRMDLNRYTHHEGFVNMPNVIKQNIFDGKMDMLFAHASNLGEATPEFIPTMRRLANRFSNVREQLARNPYVRHTGKSKVTKEHQMMVGVKHGFKGSTIGNLLRHPCCSEKAMLIALKGATDYMDTHDDHHHYHNIIHHLHVTKTVLDYILKNIDHYDVKDWAKERLGNMPKPVTRYNPKMRAKRIKIKIIKKGHRKTMVEVS